LSTSSSTRTPTATPDSASSSSDARTHEPGDFVEDEQAVFLKTTIPSRKTTEDYLGDESDDVPARVSANFAASAALRGAVVKTEILVNARFDVTAPALGRLHVHRLPAGTAQCV